MRIAITAGLRKVLARMGVSTLASYRNSHLFEIVGLSEDLCADYFEDAADYPGSKTLDDLFADYLRMHTTAFSPASTELADAGLYRFRKGAELHATSPEVVRRLHAHVRAPEAGKFAAFEELSEHQGTVFLRDLLETVPGTPVPVDEVESTNTILRRFSTQAMSLGSLSPEAHRTLALAMNLIGGRSNTGEGPPPRTKSSKSPPAASASPRTISFTPKNSKSKWRKAPSPVKAASSPLAKSPNTSRVSATPRPARR
jgi:glutamate synthase domain-containing protein 2